VTWQIQLFLLHLQLRRRQWASPEVANNRTCLCEELRQFRYISRCQAAVYHQLQRVGSIVQHFSQLCRDKFSCVAARCWFDGQTLALHGKGGIKPMCSHTHICLIIGRCPHVGRNRAHFAVRDANSQVTFYLAVSLRYHAARHGLARGKDITRVQFLHKCLEMRAF